MAKEKKITMFGLEGQGSTKSEARENCFLQLTEVISRLEGGVHHGRIGGLVFYLAPTVSGWTYGWVTGHETAADAIFKPSRDICHMGGTLAEAWRHTVVAATHYKWDHDTDDEALVTEACQALAKFCTPSIIVGVRSDLLRYFASQRRYIAAKSAGASEEVAMAALYADP